MPDDAAFNRARQHLSDARDHLAIAATYLDQCGKGKLAEFTRELAAAMTLWTDSTAPIAEGGGGTDEPQADRAPEP